MAEVVNTPTGLATDLAVPEAALRALALAVCALAAALVVLRLG